MVPEPNSRISFPQELVDYIVDHCHDDTNTLRALALVSKSWLAPARYHIFHTISVGHQSSDITGGRDLSAAVKLLTAGRSVCLLVRELTMRKITLNVPNLLPILHELPRLKRLHLQNVVFTGALPTPTPAQLSHGIDTLLICKCYVTEGASPVLELIGFFPSISELTVTYLSTMYLDDLGRISDLSRTLKTRLGSLVYYRNFLPRANHGPSAVMAQLIIELLDDASPTSLTLMPFHMNPDPAGNEANVLLISAASPNLKSLVFTLASGYVTAPSRADLSLCATLESVAFHFRLYLFNRGEHCWEDAYSVLSTLPPSSSLSTVIFLIRTNGTRPDQYDPLWFDTSDTSWIKFEQALRRLPQMRTLRFVFSHPPRSLDPESVRQWPKSMLDFIRSELHGRGLGSRYQLEVAASESSEVP